MKITKEAKPVLYISLALIAVYLLAYFSGKAKGKNQGYTRAPVDPNAVTPGFDPYPIAQKFANAFQGLNFWSGPRREVLNDLWRLTDAELSLVYNSYQDNFAEKGETMANAIKSDWVFGSEVDRIVNRLEMLGLP